jgi:hypothetical protein
MLMLELMYFPDELIDVAEYNAPVKNAVGKAEMQMAKQLKAWKQIHSRAATECHATCFRAAIKILYSQIFRLPLNGLESARDQIEKRLGRDRLNRLVPLFPRNDTHDVYRL